MEYSISKNMNGGTVTEALRIAVCEDMDYDAEQLCSLIERSGFAVEVNRFISGEDFLLVFRAGRYDLIFMDIYMKGMRGVDAVKALRETDPGVMVAFTTSSADHTLESYQVKALWYLIKPIKDEDVKGVLEHAELKKKNRPAVSITKAGGDKEDVYTDSILYFEQQRYVIDVHTVSGVITTSRSSRLDELETHLPSPPFLRCHESFIVNLDFVNKAEKSLNAFVMKNDVCVYIRRGMFPTCKKAMETRRMSKTLEGGV